MLVWVVSSYDDGLLAIFDSPEKAKNYVKEMSEGDNWVYNDWDLFIIPSQVN